MTLLHQAAQKAVEARDQLIALAHEEYADAAASVQHGADHMPEVPEWARLAALLSALQQQPEPEAPIGWLYDWTHSSALGKPDEQFTGFTTDEAYARKHDNPRAVYTAPPALQEVPRELVARIDRETVIRLAREAVSNGDGSELSGDAIERFAQLVFLEAASPSTTRQQEAGSESTRAVQLTVEEIAFVMNELTPEHDGSDFEADCPCCTAYAKLKAAVDWDAEHGIAAAPSTPEKADGVTVPVSQPKAPPGTDGGPHG